MSELWVLGLDSYRDGGTVVVRCSAILADGRYLANVFVDLRMGLGDGRLWTDLDRTASLENESLMDGPPVREALRKGLVQFSQRAHGLSKVIGAGPYLKPTTPQPPAEDLTPPTVNDP